MICLWWNCCCGSEFSPCFCLLSCCFSLDVKCYGITRHVFLDNLADDSLTICLLFLLLVDIFSCICNILLKKEKKKKKEKEWPVMTWFKVRLDWISAWCLLETTWLDWISQVVRIFVVVLNRQKQCKKIIECIFSWGRNWWCGYLNGFACIINNTLWTDNMLLSFLLYTMISNLAGIRTHGSGLC